MDATQYLELSARTVPEDYSTIATRMVFTDGDSQKSIDLMHAAMGMVTEAGEFMDAMKKSVFYGKKYDEVNLREELGDILWYVALALRALDSDFETEMAVNIEKLALRFKDKFSEIEAIDRDVAKEYEVLK